MSLDKLIENDTIRQKVKKLLLYKIFGVAC